MGTIEECKRGLHTMDNQGLCWWCGAAVNSDWVCCFRENEEMHVTDCIKEFLSWTHEQQQCCVAVFEAMNKSTESIPTIETRSSRIRRKVKRPNGNKPWSEDEDFAIMEVVEEFQPGMRAWRKLARLLGRTSKAVAVRYYQVLNKGKDEPQS